MIKIYVRTPRGNLSIECGRSAPPRYAGELVQLLGQVFQFGSIIHGIENAQLIDETGTPLHPKQAVSGGEYDLSVINTST